MQANANPLKHLFDLNQERVKLEEARKLITGPGLPATYSGLSVVFIDMSDTLRTRRAASPRA